MNGKDLLVGVVAGVTNVGHLINCADWVRTKSTHVMMVTQGAEKFCAHNGAEIFDPKWFFTQHRYNQLKKTQEKKQIVLNYDAAKKTSNAEPYIDPLMYDYKYDTVGASTYANNQTVAVSATGGR